MPQIELEPGYALAWRIKETQLINQLQTLDQQKQFLMQEASEWAKENIIKPTNPELLNIDSVNINTKHPDGKTVTLEWPAPVTDLLLAKAEKTIQKLEEIHGPTEA